MELNFHKAEGGKKFVGIEYTGNSVSIYYPESYRWQEKVPDSIDLMTGSADRFSTEIITILSTLDLAKTYSKETTDLFDSGNDEFALKAYLWLIQDYRANGVFRDREDLYKVNQNGKISWKKTMRKQPMISAGNIIYRDFVASINRPKNDLIVEIYLFCVRKSLFLAGWLMNYHESSLAVKDISEITLDTTTANRYTFAIRSELRSTFDDVKKIRLENMLAVVTGMNSSSEGKLKYGVTEYDRVFEAMVDHMFGNTNKPELFTA